MAKSKSWQDKYTMISTLGEGGNAKVYSVKCNENGHVFALKELVVGGSEKKGRFTDEINIVQANCKEVSGIIPIIDSSIDKHWYVMPIATLVMVYIDKNKLDITGIARATVQICQTLEVLHNKGISHRDIKPSNIYYFDGKFCLGDFGLVDFPENENDFTRSDKGLGAIFTIAPEMKRNPKKADGKKADVFSLAKTMWMFLTKDEKGFDGVYNYLDESHSLRFLNKNKDIHLVEIDELLKDATAASPNDRPTIKEFKERLENWLEVSSDTFKSQSSDWNFLNKLLFGLIPPSSCAWRDSQKIVNVLNVVGLTPAFNHMLFSNNGGTDFSRAKMASEDGCIEVYDTLNFCHVLKPKCLYFEAFTNNFRWNYFLLEIDSLKPIFETSPFVDYEYLIEDRPAHYVSAQYANYGVYDYENGVPLPDGFQKIYRYTNGKFLIVMKSGPYNGINGTYDGRHGDCSVNVFREYIKKLTTLYDRFYKFAKQNNQLRNLSDEDIEERFSQLEELNPNPFKNTFDEKNDMMQINQKFTEQYKSKEYIKQNYSNWNFQDVLPFVVPEKAGAIKFVFEFKNPNEHFPWERSCKTSEYITIDGNIESFNLNEDEKCYSVFDRKIAVSLIEMLENKMIKILEENNLIRLEKYETCFRIKLVKIGRPTHLFTKQEIREAMQNADDRINNQLVIDGNGYAKVIQDEGCGYLYPVRHESWHAGNVYVGKYSTLSSLEDDYISSLQGWLLYLKTGWQQNMNYVHKNTNEEELIAEIKKHYYAEHSLPSCLSLEQINGLKRA